MILCIKSHVLNTADDVLCIENPILNTTDRVLCIENPILNTSYGGLEHHLSATCVNAKEVEEAAQYLAKQLDEIVTKAQRKFSK
jgi:hypothetical protein